MRPETDAPRNEALSGRAFIIMLARNVCLSTLSSRAVVTPVLVDAERKVARSALGG